MKSSTDSYHQWREEMGAPFIPTQENSVTFIFNLISDEQNPFRAVREKPRSLWSLIFGTKGVMTFVLLWVAFHSGAWYTCSACLSCHFPAEALSKACWHATKQNTCSSHFPYSSYLSVSEAILTTPSQNQIRNLESRDTAVPPGPKWPTGYQGPNMSQNKTDERFQHLLKRGGMTS